MLGSQSQIQYGYQAAILFVNAKPLRERKIMVVLISCLWWVMMGWLGEVPY
jgi:hypothetical protein